MNMNEMNKARGEIEGKTARKIMNPLWSLLTFMLIMIIFFTGENFVTDLLSKDASYEVRLVEEETLDNGQMTYRLYKNGEYMSDVDYNDYFTLDENGNTDFHYCAMIESTRNMIYSIIFCIIILIMIKIAQNTLNGTPFTKENVKLLRLICVLEMLLAVLPGLAEFVMRTIRFNYVKGTFGFETLYPFFVAFGIAMIAQVFNYGVNLQEDSDSIL